VGATITQANARSKEIERQHLHSFQYLCKDFPGGELQERETPDFIVVTEAQRKIGIEITQVFKASEATKLSQQSIEATKEAVTVLARMGAESLKSPPAHVSLYFSLRKPLTQIARRKIAQRVAQVVHDNMPAQGEAIKLEPRGGGQRDHPIEVDLICISRVHPTDRHKWTWPEAGRVETDAIALLAESIKKKSKILKACLNSCDECWLLIVAPSFKPSGMIHPDQRSFSHIYESPFSRTYFLNFGRGSLNRLCDKRWAG